MRLRTVLSLLVVSVLLPLPVCRPARALATPDPVKPASAGAQFTVSDDTEVPGRKLSAGTYSIRILDRLSDRMIVQVSQPKGKVTIFLALPVSTLPKSGPGPVTLSAKGHAAIRGFVFPNGTSAEFVFPKAEAVKLAKANDTTIPAIDPASEGLPSDSHLSPTDLQMVTLWMLTPQPVGPDDSAPGVTAARYQAPVATARVQRPRPPVVASLPHTASELPLIWLMALLSLGSAAGLTLHRLREDARA